MNRFRLIGYRWPWYRLPRQKTILILLAYCALTIVMTWPIAGRLGTAVPASGGDTWIHLWTFDWVKEAYQTGQSPYFTNLLFYPNGVSLLFHNIAWVHIAAWLPLQALVGAEAAYSLIFLAVFALNGFATYLLAHNITGSEMAAFVGGLVVAFWPYILSHHTHPNMILIAWVPLALLYLKRFFDHQNLRNALIAAIFIALIGLTRWQLLVMGGFIIGLYVIYRLLSDETSREPRMLGLLAVISLLAILIMLPLLFPVAQAQLVRDNPEELFVEEELQQTDLLAYLVPNRYHPIWGDGAFRLATNLGANRVLVPFIGYTVLLLVIYGIFAGWPISRFWLLAALLYMILALGPDLRINGRVINLPMPYGLVEDWFLIKIIRHPDRLNVILSIPIAILTSLGIAALVRRGREKWWLLALAPLLGLFILVEYIVSYPTFPLTIPDWYKELAQEPGEFGVLGIPMNLRALPDKAYMYYQSLHGKPIVEGHVSRPPAEAFSFIEQVPLLQSLLPVEIATPDPDIINVSKQLRQLSEANIRYLIVHKAFLTREEVTAWKEWLIQEPLHEDDDLVVYRTDPLLGRDFSLAHDFAAGSDDRPGIGLIRASLSPTETTQGGAIDVSAAWASGSEVDLEIDLCLNLVGRGQDLIQVGCQQLSPDWPTSLWQADEIVSGDYLFKLSPYLPSNIYTVTLSLADQGGGNLGENVPIGSLAFTAWPRSFTEPEPSFLMKVIWDDKLSLPGYDLSFSHANSLAVTLYWRAESRMDTSYTAFLHLVDPATEAIVSQADVIPRGWTYPTSWWERGEVVEDTVLLSLEDVPPGDYKLNIGWYDLETGERLPAYSGAGEPYPHDAVFLTTIQHNSQE